MEERGLLSSMGYLPKHFQEETPIAKALLLEIALVPRGLFSSPRMLGVLCPVVPEALLASGLTGQESTSALRLLVVVSGRSDPLSTMLPPPALGIVQCSKQPASLMPNL